MAGPPPATRTRPRGVRARGDGASLHPPVRRGHPGHCLRRDPALRDPAPATSESAAPERAEPFTPTRFGPRVQPARDGTPRGGDPLAPGDRHHPRARTDRPVAVGPRPSAVRPGVRTRPVRPRSPRHRATGPGRPAPPRAARTDDPSDGEPGPPRPRGLATAPVLLLLFLVSSRGRARTCPDPNGVAIRDAAPRLRHRNGEADPSDRSRRRVGDRLPGKGPGRL